MAKDEPLDESGDVACDQCAQFFPNLPKLMAHIRKADGHEPICKQCDIPFKNFHNLRHHKRVYHIQKMTEHVCEDCGKSFPNALAARSHWNFVHKIEDDLLCNICGMSCQNMKKLKKHTQMCLAKEPDVIDKLIRDRQHIDIDSIFMKQSFEKYIKENHDADMNGNHVEDDSDAEAVTNNGHIEDSFIKSEPQEEFEYGVSHLAQSELNEDVQSPKPIIIKIKQESKIGKRDKEETNLESKEEVNPRVPSITCPFCSKEVKFFKRHMKTKHPEIPEELYLFYEKAKTKKQQTPRTSQVCPICAVEVKYLDRHIQTQHNGNDTKEFKCNECGKAFKNQYNLKDHKYAAHRKEPSMCEICSKVFKNPHALKGHVRLYHEAKEEQTCSECNNTFESKMKLYFHMRAVHTIENAKCEHCGKSYKNKSLLKKHQRVSHPEGGRGKDLTATAPSKPGSLNKPTLPGHLSSNEQKSNLKEIRTTPEVKREETLPKSSQIPHNSFSEPWTEKQSINNEHGQIWNSRRNSEEVKREVSNHIHNLAQTLCEGERTENLSSNNHIQSQYWGASRLSPEPRREIPNPIHALTQALTEGPRAENLSSNTHSQYWGTSRASHEVKTESVPHLPNLPHHLSESSWSDRFAPSNQSHSWTHTRQPTDMNFPPYYAPLSPSLPTPVNNWGRLANYPGQIPPNIWKNWWTPPPS